MNWRQVIGEGIGATLVRLVLLSIVVGIVFSALGITPANLLDRLEDFVRNLATLGINAVTWAFKYFLLGAVIVFPIWLIARLFGRRTPKA